MVAPLFSPALSPYHCKSRPLLIRLVDETHAWMAPTRQVNFQTAQRMKQSVTAHRMIFTAIQSRNPAAARNAMQEHLREVLVAIDPLTEQ